MANNSHYPSFNVMNAQDTWDDHTQAVVESRLQGSGGYQFLTIEEASLLEAVCSLLVDDSRHEIMSYVVSHIDGKLKQNMGEGQRDYGVPEARELIRGGLRAINASILHSHRTYFTKLPPQAQMHVLQQLGEGKLQPPNVWTGVPQKPLFQKLLSWTVDAYCSHPSVWSEIGYAGPAYPRGYFRTQIGQLEPWEAQPEA